jgi:hypothetical protein
VIDTSAPLAAAAAPILQTSIMSKHLAKRGSAGVKGTHDEKRNEKRKVLTTILATDKPEVAAFGAVQNH